MKYSWLQLASVIQLAHSRGYVIEVELFNGQTGTLLGWRRANVPSKVQGVPPWVGPALRLLIDGEVTHGWDPATVVKVILRFP